MGDLQEIEEILDHLLAGGDAPPHAKSESSVVRKLHTLARERIQVREGTRAFSYLSTISHELRTPLNAIIGYSELLLEEEAHYEPADLKADVTRIHHAGRHLLGLVNEVIEVARIESGHTQLQRRTVAVEPLIRELMPTLMPVIRSGGNQFAWQVDRDLQLWSDAPKLRTVLRTLVNRAARVTSNGEIKLSALLVDEQVRIQVEDTGERVSTENLARTFHPFIGGSGQGLTSTARLVELLGGTLEVEALSQGTRFCVILPSPERRTEDEEPLPTVPEGAQVVLVATSAPDVGLLIARQLTTLDVVVVQAHSGPEAVHMAEALKPAVIALDAGLSQIDGWDTLGALKGRPDLASIPVVMLSGDEETLEADDYIAKPFERSTMLKTISRLLSEGGRKRVLVVDDEADARELARRVLTSVGYLVDEVPHGQAALDYLQRETPDLVLLDLMMPEMDGFQVLQELKEQARWSSIPVVVLTAMSLTDADRELLSSRAQSVVSKGTAPSTLLDRLRSALN